MLVGAELGWVLGGAALRTARRHQRTAAPAPAPLVHEDPPSPSGDGSDGAPRPRLPPRQNPTRKVAIIWARGKNGGHLRCVSRGGPSVLQAAAVGPRLRCRRPAGRADGQ